MLTCVEVNILIIITATALKSKSCPPLPLLATQVYSEASVTPPGPMENCASLSGSEGDAMILTFLFSPRPLLSERRVVVACAMMLPPMGLRLGPANMDPPSRLAATT